MIDRDLQHQLLICMKDHYPAFVSFRDILPEWAITLEQKNRVMQNLYYLGEHELAHVNGRQVPSTYEFHITSARITQNGIDFLAQDGGLSAIFGVVTVRLHADTIRELIEAKILASNDVPKGEKPKLIEALKAMPEEAMRQLTQRIIGYGLDQAPNAWSAVISALTN